MAVGLNLFIGIRAPSSRASLPKPISSVYSSLHHLYIHIQCKYTRRCVGSNLRSPWKSALYKMTISWTNPPVIEWFSARTYNTQQVSKHVQKLQFWFGVRRRRRREMEKYEVVKDLGAGNFGVARLLRHKETKELVAMKYIERGRKVWYFLLSWVVSALERFQSFVFFFFFLKFLWWV